MVRECRPRPVVRPGSSLAADGLGPYVENPAGVLVARTPGVMCACRAPQPRTRWMLTLPIVQGAFENEHPGVVGGLVPPKTGTRADLDHLRDGPLGAHPQGTYGDTDDPCLFRSHRIDLRVLAREEGNFCHTKRLSFG